MKGMKKHWPIYMLFAVLGAAALSCSLVDICPLFETIHPAIKINKTAIIDFIRGLGPWGPLGSIGLMIVHSFVPFPSEFLTMANGMLFGPFWGVVITWLGCMSGAFVSFGLTRRFGRPFVLRVLNDSQLETLDRWVQQQGPLLLLLGRFIPLISFNLMNYGAGLTPVSWWTFTWTTGIGILPITIIMVIMGSSFHVLPWWAWLAVLLMVAGMAAGAKTLQKKYGKA